MNRLPGFALACLFVLLATFATAQETSPTKSPQSSQEAASQEAPSQEELEAKFAEKLSGATLVGQFTVSDVNDGKPLAQDKYQLGKVFKLPNGLWSLEARIQYGKHDVKLPLALPVKWAGDTPVITVTKVAFPGLGTYSARVLFYDDSYAGTWSGSTHGGEMWGKIVRGDAAKPADPAPADEKPADNKLGK